MVHGRFFGTKIAADELMINGPCIFVKVPLSMDSVLQADTVIVIFT